MVNGKVIISIKKREECEEKLAGMIVQVKAQIKAGKESMTGGPVMVTLSKFASQ